MFQIKIENMNLAQIADSGQCFRWKKIEENKYSVVAYGHYVEIEQDGQNFTFSCTKKEWQEIWYDYFDMDTDYEDIKRKIMESGDEHLIRCYELGSGVRILKQDLWEIIVSFIISQNNNIKRITKSVDDLCRVAGKTCENIEGLSDGDLAYRFPLPGEVPESVFDDKSMGFGYRDAYLKGIYAYALENPKWVDSLKGMSYDDAMNSLLAIKGIGKKVANCICLFGLHHVDAFPIDTHVKQLLEEHYADGFDFDRYRGVAGIIQQYLFYYELIK